ncbi:MULTISPECIES: xanthine dehydrogenase family protein subunit M [unclassified Paludibacterium]|uniref:FAD binding domain-containing protein n=1 Tax=unclassified Paludibacterium TaxID=2618429 RepID=UPI001C054068|nr:xanthine dehydrogenase family protein subunit M [Paludibacterium sp. B53371]BEV71542.1 xanthine dehydrogenase family protein subunit M [Paludibacterium sp. THUN1379]
MRQLTAQCQVCMPASLGTALEVMATEPGVWRPIAGGTDLMVPLPPHVPEVTHFLDLNRLKELKGIQEDEHTLTFGALTTFTALRQTPAVHRHFPCLIKSARSTAALAIQNRGTLGGNIMNGSPAADTPPSLLVYDAEVALCSLRGERWVPLTQFWTGYKQFDRAPDELLTRIRVRKPQGRSFHYFRKVGAREAQAIAKASMAAMAEVAQGRVSRFRLATGALSPCCARVPGVEALIEGRTLSDLPLAAACEALQQAICPIDDVRSTALYRRQVAGNLLEALLQELSRLND